MNFLQLHEQLRQELLRRINRGVLTGTLLARQTGLKPAHISNFLHRKRRLSLDALDRVLTAQSLSIANLLPANFDRSLPSEKEDEPQPGIVPLVSQTVAMYEAQIRKNSILELIHLPAEHLDHLRTRRSAGRNSWDRFVAVRASFAQADAMTPAISPHSILIIDRHYNSLTPHRPPAPSIYAVQHGTTIVFRYATLQGNCVVLRPHKLEHSIDLIELSPAESPGSLIIGRICVSISEA
jgi:transcriptional regulator with XRE-family HTH domain